MNKNIKDKLLRCFKQPLPGLASHLEMAPLYRREQMKSLAQYPNAYKSSVLILFYEKSNVDYLVFIKRPTYNGVHSGQIALPGGKWEVTDKSLYHTALREAREEIGIELQEVSLCGKLTDLYIPPSNFMVSPFVGFYKAKAHFLPDPVEVDEIIEIPFSFFLDIDRVRTITLELISGLKIETPCFDFHGNIIWGATAMIMNELIILWKTTV